MAPIHILTETGETVLIHTSMFDQLSRKTPPRDTWDDVWARLVRDRQCEIQLRLGPDTVGGL